MPGNVAKGYTGGSRRGGNVTELRDSYLPHRVARPWEAARAGPGEDRRPGWCFESSRSCGRRRRTACLRNVRSGKDLSWSRPARPNALPSWSTTSKSPSTRIEPSVRTVIFVAAIQSSGKSWLNRRLNAFPTWSTRGQYFGTLGSTSSDHARIPPFRFDILRKPAPAQKFHRFGGPLSAAAVRDDLARAVELVHAPRQFAERNQVPVDIADLIFVRLAHVQNVDIVAAIEPRLQLRRRNFRNIRSRSLEPSSPRIPQNSS